MNSRVRAQLPRTASVRKTVAGTITAGIVGVIRIGETTDGAMTAAVTINAARVTGATGNPRTARL